MDIIPAVDILGGSVVRLTQGDYEAVTTYGRDPAAVVRRFTDEGAPLVHVVDLEAARGGARQSTVLRAILEGNALVQVGGGVRTADDAKDTMALGASRVVVGSVLVDSDVRAAHEIVEAVGGDAVVAAIDVRAGRVRGSGWLDEGAPLGSVLERVHELGIGRMLVTGIDRDGTMAGPDLDLLADVARSASGIGVIASGGVGSLDDIRAIRDLPEPVNGIIVGRALYEDRFTLGQAIAAAT